MTTSETISVWVRILLFVTLGSKYLKNFKIEEPMVPWIWKKKLKKKKHHPFSLLKPSMNHQNNKQNLDAPPSNYSDENFQQTGICEVLIMM